MHAPKLLTFKFIYMQIFRMYNCVIISLLTPQNKNIKTLPTIAKLGFFIPNSKDKIAKCIVYTILTSAN